MRKKMLWAQILFFFLAFWVLGYWCCSLCSCKSTAGGPGGDLTLLVTKEENSAKADAQAALQASGIGIVWTRDSTLWWEQRNAHTLRAGWCAARRLRSKRHINCGISMYILCSDDVHGSYIKKYQTVPPPRTKISHDRIAGWWFQMFSFLPYLGRWSRLTSIFFRWVIGVSWFFRRGHWFRPICGYWWEHHLQGWSKAAGAQGWVGNNLRFEAKKRDSAAHRSRVIGLPNHFPYEGL